MTLEKIKEILESTGLPVTYTAWPERQAPPMPYICYLTAYTNNFAADGVVYQQIFHVQIEPYTRRKDPKAEKLVENATLERGQYWNKSEERMNTDKCKDINNVSEV